MNRESTLPVSREPPPFLDSDGEMAERIRQYDWGRTPLGVPEQWPQLLKITVHILLTSRHPMSIWWGPELIQLYNDAYRETLESDQHPLTLGRPARESWPETWEIIGPEIAQVMQGKPVWQEDRPVPIKRNGVLQDTWWNYSLSPLEEQRTVQGILAICSEVTEKHKQRENLELAYQALFGSMDEAFCVLQPARDTKGTPVDCRFLEANPAFERQTGHADPTGLMLREEFPCIGQEWMGKIAGVAESGRPLHVERQFGDSGAWFEFDLFRIDTAGSATVGVLFRDVSEAKRGAAALIESRQQAENALARLVAKRALIDAVLEATPIAIGVADSNGALTHLNEENKRLWGRNLPMSRSINEYDEWKGWFAAGTEREGKPLAAGDWPLARALRGESNPRELIEIETFETPSQRKTVLATAAPIRGDHGDIIGGVVALMDISDRVRAEQELRVAHQRKDDFLAVLAHELRNPLAPIAGAADLIVLQQSDPAKLQQTASIISRQVRHMTELLGDLLDLSQISRDLTVLEKKPVDAKRIATLAMEQAQPTIEARGHTLQVIACAEPAMIEADQRRLLQVLANLLNNAAKYTPRDGTITLQIEAEDQHVMISIQDDGIGMTADFVERAFDLFAQAERGTSASQCGLGIGLALSKRLVELHGGSIRAESAGLEKGSRMTICLPRISHDGSTVSSNQVPASELPTGIKRNILLVDDNIDAADMLANVLRSVGHTVRIAHSARSAIEAAHQEPLEALLLNIGLPDMSGYELARTLRQDARNGNCLFIAVTGYGQADAQQAAINAGFDYHFVKPVPTDRLCELLAFGHLREAT